MSRIRDANIRPLPIDGMVKLRVKLGNKMETVKFFVSELLAAAAIIGCYFCDKHIEEIRPQQRTVELDDGTTVTIVRKTDRNPGTQYAPYK